MESIKVHYQLRNVWERLAKNLVKKGLLTTEKQSFLLFDMTTHPLTNNCIKQPHQEGAGSRSRQMGERPSPHGQAPAGLLYLAHASDVLENAFAPLLDEQYDVATRWMRQLPGLGPVECLKAGTNEVLWAVVAFLVTLPKPRVPLLSRKPVLFLPMDFWVSAVCTSTL